MTKGNYKVLGIHSGVASTLIVDLSMNGDLQVDRVSQNRTYANCHVSGNSTILKSSRIIPLVFMENIGNISEKTIPMFCHIYSVRSTC